MTIILWGAFTSFVVDEGTFLSRTAKNDVHAVVRLLGIDLEVVESEELRHLRVRVVTAEIEVASGRRVFFVLFVSVRKIYWLSWVMRH